jgi:hypothetical protein
VEKNYHRELAGKPPIQVSLNRIFIGNPGTGKTSVGRLYAAILAELELLSKNEGKFYPMANSRFPSVRRHEEILAHSFVLSCVENSK